MRYIKALLEDIWSKPWPLRLVLIALIAIMAVLICVLLYWALVFTNVMMDLSR